MKRTGAWLVRFAFEQLGVRYVFGIPGVHTTELFDEFASSDRIEPVLVSHECGGGFMADAIGRTGQGVAALAVVPGAGLTHAASAIGEAFLDGVPMIVLSGGVRLKNGRAFQLHDIDQQALMAPLTKACWKIQDQMSIVPTLYRAWVEAGSGRPGPVYVELPVDILMFAGEIGALPEWPGRDPVVDVDATLIESAARQLAASSRPGLYVGWGARRAREQLVALAETLGAPVATSLQGLSSFPAEHPLHVGMGFGKAAVPAARNAFKNCDALVAVGVSFSEVGTGSYSIEVPETLIHIDIDPSVFGRNYPASVAIASDAAPAVTALNHQLLKRGVARDATRLAAQLARDKAAYLRDFRKHGDGSRVNPARLFQVVDQLWPRDVTVVADDGNHTFLTAELLPMSGQRCFISPTDFNCMGYAVPAAVGAKLSAPERDVLAIVGDGAFLMTSNELLTANRLELGIVYLIFNDGELAQIAQAQQLPYNRKTCTVLMAPDIAALAKAMRCDYCLIEIDQDIESVLTRAREIAAAQRPVVVDVRVDYSRKSAFTQGIMQANSSRLPGSEKRRIGARALTRRLLPAGDD